MNSIIQSKKLISFLFFALLLVATVVAIPLQYHELNEIWLPQQGANVSDYINFSGTQNTTSMRIGYKTGFPLQKLSVETGRVGIRTQNPLAPLHIFGSVYTTVPAGSGTTTQTQTEDVLVRLQRGTSTNYWQFGIDSDGDMNILENTGVKYTAKATTGFVGIGTENPVAKLDVQYSANTLSSPSQVSSQAVWVNASGTSELYQTGLVTLVENRINNAQDSEKGAYAQGVVSLAILNTDYPHSVIDNQGVRVYPFALGIDGVGTIHNNNAASATTAIGIVGRVGGQYLGTGFDYARPQNGIGIIGIDSIDTNDCLHTIGGGNYAGAFCGGLRVEERTIDESNNHVVENTRWGLWVNSTGKTKQYHNGIVGIATNIIKAEDLQGEDGNSGATGITGYGAIDSDMARSVKNSEGFQSYRFATGVDGFATVRNGSANSPLTAVGTVGRVSGKQLTASTYDNVTNGIGIMGLITQDINDCVGRTGTGAYAGSFCGNVKVSSGYVILNSGTTGTPVEGAMRYNSATKKFEGYTGIAWVALN